MPKGLMDKLSADEILDLVAYVASGGDDTTSSSRAADTTTITDAGCGAQLDQPEARARE